MGKATDGVLDEEDWLLTAAMAGTVKPLFILMIPHHDSNGYRAKARRLVQEQGQALIIVDYLQLLDGRRAFDSRQQEITEISRGLKALAGTNGPGDGPFPTQPAVEQRQDKQPVLSDLRESGPSSRMPMWWPSSIGMNTIIPLRIKRHFGNYYRQTAQRPHRADTVGLSQKYYAFSRFEF